MRASTPPFLFLVRLILVVVGLAVPGMVPAGPVPGEAVSAAGARPLAAALPALPEPEALPVETALAGRPTAPLGRPDTTARRLLPAQSAIPAGLSHLPPRARGPPLA